VPTLANNLSVANGEFDQVALTKRNRWGVRFRDYRVSKPKQCEFNCRV
jgi:predicted phage gp36 major capsid-like protein